MPIFPLPIVLMPFELLPLHIFEERYRQMFKDIKLTDNLFGLSYFEPEMSLSGKPEIGAIGCAAEVRDVQTQPDGRSNILTVGVTRYRLLEYVETLESYLEGELEFFEDEPENEESLQALADEVFGKFKKIARTAHKMSGQRGEFPEIPQAPPEQLSFLVSAAFNIEPQLKYEFIKTRSTSERLDRLREILDQAVRRIEESAQILRVAQTNGHSKKKVDL